MSSPHRAGRIGFAVLLGVLSSACSDDEPTGPVGVQLSVDPGTISVPQGSSGTVTVSLGRVGFSGAVTLAVSGLPTGVTTTITPPQLSGAAANAVVQVNVAGTVAPGTYPATVTATAQGTAGATVTFQLTVTAASSGGAVEYLFCSASETPVFFGFQDGDGAWQAVAGTVSGAGTRFAFTLNHGHGGVLLVYESATSAIAATSRSARLRQPTARADGFLTQVQYASAAELVQSGSETCANTQPTKSVAATIAGVPSDSYGIVSLGGVTNLFDPFVSTNPVTFNDVPEGPVDLFGTLATPGNPPSRLVIARNLNVADGGTLPSAVDFNGPASLVPATAQANISGGAGDDLEIFTDLVTANGQGGLWFDLSPSASSTRPWAGLPTASMMAGDLHGLFVFATRTDGTGDFRFALKYVGPVADQTLILGPALATPTISQVAAGAYPRFRFQGTLTPEYNKGATVDVLGPEGAGNTYSIMATTTWLATVGDALAYAFTMPDVAALAGFPAASRLATGTNDVSVSGFGFTGAGIFDLRPALGGEFRAAITNATVSVP